MLTKMEKRKVLLELTEDSVKCYNEAYNAVKTRLEGDNIALYGLAFSANVGKYGGFVTDYLETWEKWNET